MQFSHAIQMQNETNPEHAMLGRTVFDNSRSRSTCGAHSTQTRLSGGEGKSEGRSYFQMNVVCRELTSAHSRILGEATIEKAREIMRFFTIFFFNFRLQINHTSQENLVLERWDREREISHRASSSQPRRSIASTLPASTHSSWWTLDYEMTGWVGLLISK